LRLCIGLNRARDQHEDTRRDPDHGGGCSKTGTNMEREDVNVQLPKGQLQSEWHRGLGSWRFEVGSSATTGCLARLRESRWQECWRRWA
jgi:hypothetical protein